MKILKFKYVYFIISLAVIITGLTVGFTKGFKFDIDFKGGTKITTDLKQDFNNKDIENIIKEVINKNALVQKSSEGNSTVNITIDVISNEDVEKICNKLKEKYTSMEEPTTRNVQPAFGKELIETTTISVIVSLIAILVYVTIRFKVLGFKAALTAVIALLHDALVIISIYAIFNLPINSTFVAVILTIIGYSINDTIVVYDRIRENKRNVRTNDNLEEVVNNSVNQTMKRTIFTSITTLLAIVSVYVFAVIYNQQVLKEFSFPLMLGVLVGTYSSICIATPLWYVLDTKFGKNKLKK